MKDFITGILIFVFIIIVLSIILELTSPIQERKYISPMGTPNEKEYCMGFSEKSFAYTPMFCLKYFIK